jgi:hypothetical protein
MHVGFETTPVLGAKRQLGDTWTMMKWQFSGKMGGKPGSGSDSKPGNGHSGGHAGKGTTMMPPPPAADLVSPDGTLRVL